MDNKIDKLPLELILNIYKYLPIKDQFKLKCVSKRYLEVFKYLQFDTLNVYQYDYFLTDKKTKFNLNFYGGSIELLTFLSLNNNILILFKKIKKLKTYFNNLSDLNFNKFYNQFSELQILHCNHSKKSKSKKIELNLEKLLKLKLIKSFNSEFDLNCPNLEYLIVDRLRNINLKCDKNLKKLIFISTDPINEDELNRISKIINLEILDIDNDDLGLINNNLLSNKFPKLKELHIRKSNESVDQLNEFKNHRQNLLIFLNGYEIDTFRKVFGYNPIYLYNNNESEYFLDNKFTNVIFKSRTDYTEYLFNSSFDFKYNLISKKLNVSKIIFIMDETGCEFELLNHIEIANPTILNLYIKITQLDLSFFSKLSYYGKSLNKIKLNCQIKELPLEFIRKLDKLTYLQFSIKPTYEYLINLIQYSKDMFKILIKDKSDLTIPDSIDELDNGLIINHELKAINYSIKFKSVVLFKIKWICSDYEKLISKEIRFQNQNELIEFLKEGQKLNDDTKFSIFTIEEFKINQIYFNLIIKQLIKRELISINREMYNLIYGI